MSKEPTIGEVVQAIKQLRCRLSALGKRVEDIEVWIAEVEDTAEEKEGEEPKAEATAGIDVSLGDNNFFVGFN